jgi:hypothetical protein
MMGASVVLLRLDAYTLLGPVGESTVANIVDPASVRSWSRSASDT